MPIITKTLIKFLLNHFSEHKIEANIKILSPKYVRTPVYLPEVPSRPSIKVKSDISVDKTIQARNNAEIKKYTHMFLIILIKPLKNNTNKITSVKIISRQNLGIFIGSNEFSGVTKSEIEINANRTIFETNFELKFIVES